MGEAPEVAPSGREQAASPPGRNFVGRRSELGALEAALRRADRGEFVAVAVVGHSGIGKSAMLHEFTGSSELGLRLSGKYEQTSTRSQVGIVEALRQLTRAMLGQPADVVGAWTRLLRRDIGVGGDELRAVVPELDAVLGARGPGVTRSSGARSRLIHAATALLDATAATAGPVLLAIDDVQWADPPDVEILAGLISARPAGVMLVGVWRTSLIRSLDQLEDETGVALERVHVGPLTTKEVVELLSTDGTSNVGADIAGMIVERTGGNPLFIDRLVRSAEEDGAWRFDVVSGSWTWDPAWLSGQDVADDLAEFLAGALGRLDPTTREVLAAASCLGGPFSLMDAVVAADRLREEVATSLWAAVEQRMLVQSGASTEPAISLGQRYRFSHDRIEEAANHLLSEHDRCEVHLRIGRNFRSDGPSRLAEAATHLRLARTLITDAEERREVCTLAHDAARAARDQASFRSAQTHFDTALAMLDSLPTAVDPSLRSTLAYGRAEASWLSGHEQVDEHWQVAQQSAVSSIDRARVAHLRMKMLLARHEQREAMQIALESLGELGIALPSNTSRPRLILTLGRTARALRARSDAELAALPKASDPHAVAAAPIIAELFSTTYTLDPDLFPFVVLKAVDLTLEKGRMPISPVAFAGYGLLLTVLGRHDGALRFGDLARTLVDDDESLPYRPWVHFIHYNFIHHWRRPLADCVEPVRAAQLEALERGDPEYAGYLAAVELAQRFNRGLPLERVDRRAGELIVGFPREYKQVELCEAVRQLAHNLSGRNRDTWVLSGTTGYDEEAVWRDAEAAGDLVSLAVNCSVRLQVRFWAGDYEGATRLAPSMEQHIGGLTGTIVVPIVRWMLAISSLRTSGAERDALRDARRFERRLRRWAAGAPWNYSGYLWLLRAEIARVAGRDEDEAQALDEAAAASDRFDNPLLGALAREWSAEHHQRVGRRTAARAFLIEAGELWDGLGYRVRLRTLLERHTWLATAGGVSSLAEQRESEDLDAFLQRALSSLAGGVGATRVALLLPRDEVLEVRVVVDSSGSHVLSNPQPIETGMDYPASLLRLCWHTRDIVAVEEPDSSHADPYVASGAVASAMAIPVAAGQRAVAVLYAEHDTERGCFPADVRRELTARASELARPLDNAILRARLDVAERSRAALAATQARLVPTEWLRALGAEGIDTLEAGGRVERIWSVLFSDLRAYSSIAEHLSSREISELVTGFLRAVEAPIVAHGGFVHDTRGDEVLALFPGGPGDAIAAARGMVRAQRRHNDDRRGDGRSPVTWGIGVNHGEMSLGMVEGVNRLIPGVLGDSLNLASRIESLTRRYDVGLLASEYAIEALPPGLDLHVRRVERVCVVNRETPVTLYEVFDEDDEATCAAKLAATARYEEAFALYDAGDFQAALEAFTACLEALPGDRVAQLHVEHCGRLATDRPVDWNGATLLTSK